VKSLGQMGIGTTEIRFLRLNSDIFKRTHYKFGRPKENTR